MTTTTTTTNPASASFDAFNLHPKLLQAVQACKYTIPTEIQQKAIPEVLQGRDLIASAETGSGKTVAFVLPALQRLLEAPSPHTQGRGPRVLILTPTRELATQITEAIGALNKFANFRFGTIIGQVPYYAQEKMLREKLDLLVATPGRLMDHMNRGRVDFSRMELFILDEADRMLDMGFVNDMQDIASALPAEHQTLLFSATFEGAIQNIARQFLKDPVRIQLTSATKKHTLISQRVHLVDNFNHKRALLAHVLEEPGMWQAIVFTATKRGADELVEDLCEQGIHCAALHGDMKQSKRSRTLEQMHRGKLRVLVATDVAARGIDIKKLTHVINFDLPRTPPDYVHRIGRAGRCGEKGTAISLVGSKERALLAQIERFTGQKLTPVIVPGFEPKLTFKSTQEHSRSDRSGSGQRSSRPRTGGGGSRFKEAEPHTRSNQGQGPARGGKPRSGPSFSNSKPRSSEGRSFEPRSFRSKGEGSNTGESRFEARSFRSKNEGEARRSSEPRFEPRSFRAKGEGQSSSSRSSGQRSAGSRNENGRSGKPRTQDAAKASPRFQRSEGAARFQKSEPRLSLSRAGSESRAKSTSRSGGGRSASRAKSSKPPSFAR